MAVSRMLKMQLLAHDSIREEVKRYLREAGIVEITEVSLGEGKGAADEEALKRLEGILEWTDSAIQFLEAYTEKPSFLERLSRGAFRVSGEQVEKLSRDISVEDVWLRCGDLQRRIRSCAEDLARSRGLVRALEPWAGIEVDLSQAATESYTVQFWTLPAKASDIGIRELEETFPLVEFEECSRRGGNSHTAVILPTAESGTVEESLKKAAGYRSAFEGLEGTPAGIIESERARWEELESEITEAEGSARETAAVRDKLLLLSDYYRESIGLQVVERLLHRTERTFVIEGWVRAVDRGKLEGRLNKAFAEIELSFREAREDEEPPIHLVNRPVASPYEFVTTLYGRPAYREIDPTPLLAPFFILFFALCLTDAGYGLALSAVSALAILKLKPSGGTAKLLRLLFIGGLVTVVIGMMTGGIFGIEPRSLPPLVKNFVFINPLEEPMKMLNITFLMGLVHILFGMGIRMAANFRAGLIKDALFDDFLWIAFLAALAPLGFAGILGGDVPPSVVFWSKRLSVVIAACIFLTGGRKQKSVIKKFFGGLVGFYDIVGYFGDVLSYARLLALGLATSAIALAVNGIAGMVKGLPFFTGYLAAVLVLVLGHAFNLAVNTLGAFVHSGRLQYLEFFSKFFTGGGREFLPFKSERRYSIMKETGKGF